jgi:hypothetical protein
MTEKPTLDGEATNISPAESTVASSEVSSAKPVVGKQWVKGQSGNPRGYSENRRSEPRVRRYARKYDQRMVKVLASIAENPEVSPTERRRAAMDLIAIGSGRPATTQELVGRPDAPLVNINMGGATPDNPLRVASEIEAAAAYSRVIRGELDVDAVRFETPAPVEPAALPAPAEHVAPIESADVEEPEDPRVGPRSPDLSSWQGLLK